MVTHCCMLQVDDSVLGGIAEDDALGVNRHICLNRASFSCGVFDISTLQTRRV